MQLLCDDARLLAQLCTLERRTAWGGRDSIDHAPGGHDDRANAVAGALVACLSSGEPAMLVWMRGEYEKLRAAGAVR